MCVNGCDECMRSIEFDIITTLWLLQLVCAIYFPFFLLVFVLLFRINLMRSIRCERVCVCKERNRTLRTSKWEQKYDSEYFGHSFFLSLRPLRRPMIAKWLCCYHLFCVFFLFLRANKCRRTENFWRQKSYLAQQSERGNQNAVRSQTWQSNELMLFLWFSFVSFAFGTHRNYGKKYGYFWTIIALNWKLSAKKMSLVRNYTHRKKKQRYSVSMSMLF